MAHVEQKNDHRPIDRPPFAKVIDESPSSSDDDSSEVSEDNDSDDENSEDWERDGRLVNSATLKPQWRVHNRDGVFYTMIQGDHSVYFQEYASHGYWLVKTRVEISQRRYSSLPAASGSMHECLRVLTSFANFVLQARSDQLLCRGNESCGILLGKGWLRRNAPVVDVVLGARGGIRLSLSREHSAVMSIKLRAFILFAS